MHPLKPSVLAALLTLACSPSDSGTTAGTTTSPETGSTADTPAGVTTTAAASTSDSGTDHGDGTHEPHDTHGETGGSETAAVTTTDTTHATHDTHATHATDEPETTGGATPVDEYCACMLESCHDLYHATWGEEHRASEAMCAAYAESVPSVGMPAMSGDSLECRLHFCSLGHDDPSACDSAMGAAPCE